MLPLPRLTPARASKAPQRVLRAQQVAASGEAGDAAARVPVRATTQTSAQMPSHKRETAIVRAATATAAYHIQILLCVSGWLSGRAACACEERPPRVLLGRASCNVRCVLRAGYVRPCHVADDVCCVTKRASGAHTTA